MTPELEINNRCISCDACRIICPEKAILKHGINYAIETWSCTLCSICIEVCPVDCIKYVDEESK